MFSRLSSTISQSKYTAAFRRHRLFIRYTHENASTKKYTGSILLPQTNFPARFNGRKRAEMDNYLLEKCGFADLYSWQRANLAEPEFVLHDGPPYANGKPHMGHAINKILKDITLRSRVIQGQKVHYVPGWDCHGLPIELKALSATKESAANLTPLQIRHKARDYAVEAVENQRNVFISWGVMADWKESSCYFTNHTSYVTNQLRQFITLYEKGFVRKDFKPVYWSPSSRTALAESELEYNKQHRSKCVTIKLRLDVLPPSLKSYEGRSIYAPIWTTTPWSLVANQAVAYATDAKYCITEDANMNLYIVAEDLLTDFEQKCGNMNKLTTIKGNELEGGRYFQPVTGTSSPFLPGPHVTTIKGTGLVHIAPAHGMDDFLVGLTHELPVISLVDERGSFTAEAGPQLAGLNVLKEGTEALLNQIENDVLHSEIFEHSYPYDWRTKKPVIIRASRQWFLNTDALKQQALDCLHTVRVYPECNSNATTNGLVQQIKQRPYWCISRQRVWGTPIPVLYRKDTGDVITNRIWIERLCHLIEKYGPDCWWDLPIEKLAGKDILRENDVSNLEKGEDILDIWFDSGISWSAVLPNGKADLYMEGIDQFTGWFQSSLITSVALQNAAPYKSLFAHGFAVDDKGHKMSKSLGNVIDPDEVTKGGKDLNKKPAYGVDTLRWWVAGHGTQHTQIPVTDRHLKQSAESVQKIRMVMRFLLGSLHRRMSDNNNSPEPEYQYIDKYVLHQLYHYNKQMEAMYNKYEYHNVCKAIIYFVTNTVSGLYCHLIKDRLYCSRVDSPYRAGAIDVCSETLAVLARSIAPIIPHLAEEIWLHHPENLASVPLFHSTHRIPENWNQPRVEHIIQSALEIRTEVNKLAKINTWQLSGIIELSPERYSEMKILQRDEESTTSELCELLQLSSITLRQKMDIEKPEIILEPIEQTLCQRCRRHPEPRPDALCDRCAQVLSSIST